MQIAIHLTVFFITLALFWSGRFNWAIVFMIGIATDLLLSYILFPNRTEDAMWMIGEALSLFISALVMVASLLLAKKFSSLKK